jgi:hypothetical protein
MEAGTDLRVRSIEVVPRLSATMKLSRNGEVLHYKLTADCPRVPAVYLTSVNALFFAIVALNKINNLRVMNQGQNSDFLCSQVLWHGGQPPICYCGDRSHQVRLDLPLLKQVPQK